MKMRDPISECAIKMNLYRQKITLFGVYGVNDDATGNQQEDFFEQLHDGTVEIGNIREIILMRNLNGRTGIRNGDDDVGKYGEKVVNNNRKRIITICEQNEMKIMNGFFQHKEIHEYTWKQETRQMKFIIHYIIVKRMKIHAFRLHSEFFQVPELI